MVKRFVPDTNFLLHFKDPSELPWEQVTPDIEIELILVDEVIRELDGHKRTGSSRRARRAKNLSSMIRPLVDESLETIEIRVKSPRVVMKLAAIDPLNPGQFSAGKGDTQIAFEAHQCALKLEDDDLTLLTDDTIAVKLARAAGIKAMFAPEDWRLVEPDEQERQIKKLEEEIRLRDSKSPKIEVSLLGESVHNKVIRGVYSHYPPLSGEFVQSVMSAVREKYPEEIGADLDRITVVLEEDKYKYQLGRKVWEHNLRDKLSRLPLLLSAKSSPVPLALSIKNIGSIPADHPILDIDAKGPIRLVDIKAHEGLVGRLSLNFPRPPNLRQIVDGNLHVTSTVQPPDYLRIGNLPTFKHRIPSRDLEWVFDDPTAASKHCRGECSELRHALDEEVFNLHLRASPDVSGDQRGSFQVKCSAKNLVKIEKSTWRVELECITEDTEAAVVQILATDLGVKL